MKTEETVAIVLIVVLAMFLFGGFGWGMMGYGNYGMMSGLFSGFGFSLFAWLYHAVILIALILLIIWLVKQLQNSGGRRR